MYIFLTSTQSPYNLTVKQFTDTLNLKPDVTFICSGGGTIVVNLPMASSLPGDPQFAYLVPDSSTTLTVNTPDSFDNGTQVFTRTAGPGTISNPNAGTAVEINGVWLIYASGGNGGGGSSNLVGFDVTIPTATVTSLLNDDTTSFSLITNLGLNTGIQIFTASAMMINGLTPYNGTNPQLYIAGNDGPNTNALYVTSTNYLNDSSNANIISNLNRVASVVGIVVENSPILVRSVGNYGVTAGNFDLRIFGWYIVKNL